MAAKWISDPMHSEMQFKIRHLMISSITGRFDGIKAEVESDGEDFSNAKVSFTVEVGSINTGNKQRDEHLTSADFFDAQTYPTMHFESDGFNAATGRIVGDLTIKDVTKPIAMDVEFSGTAKDPWGNEKAGFSLHGTINRTDYGLTWNSALETGGFLIGEDVKLSAEVQLVRQKE